MLYPPLQLSAPGSYCLGFVNSILYRTLTRWQNQATERCVQYLFSEQTSRAHCFRWFKKSGGRGSGPQCFVCSRSSTVILLMLKPRNSSSKPNRKTVLVKKGIRNRPKSQRQRKTKQCKESKWGSRGHVVDLESLTPQRKTKNKKLLYLTIS